MEATQFLSRLEPSKSQNCGRVVDPCMHPFPIEHAAPISGTAVVDSSHQPNTLVSDGCLGYNSGVVRHILNSSRGRGSHTSSPITSCCPSISKLPVNAHPLQRGATADADAILAYASCTDDCRAATMGRPFLSNTRTAHASISGLRHMLVAWLPCCRAALLAACSHNQGEG